MRVAEGAIRACLHAESCHPSLKISAVDATGAGRLCSVPGLVVDPCVAVVDAHDVIRVPAEFEVPET